MNKPLFKVGQIIFTVKNGVKGHVVAILRSSATGGYIYYCSMYPGAEADYVYMYIIDPYDFRKRSKNSLKGELTALNIYNEDEIRKNKTDKSIVKKKVGDL
jgi:hypothetical protein